MISRPEGHLGQPKVEVDPGCGGLNQGGARPEAASATFLKALPSFKMSR